MKAIKQVFTRTSRSGSEGSGGSLPSDMNTYEFASAVADEGVAIWEAKTNQGATRQLATATQKTQAEVHKQPPGEKKKEKPKVDPKKHLKSEIYKTAVRGALKKHEEEKIEAASSRTPSEDNASIAQAFKSDRIPESALPYQKALLSYKEFRLNRERYAARAEREILSFLDLMDPPNFSEITFSMLHGSLMRFRDYRRIMTKFHNKMMAEFPKAFPNADADAVVDEDGWLSKKLQIFDAADAGAACALGAKSDFQPPGIVWPPEDRPEPVETPDQVERLESATYEEIEDIKKNLKAGNTQNYEEIHDAEADDADADAFHESDFGHPPAAQAILPAEKDPHEGKCMPTAPHKPLATAAPAKSPEPTAAFPSTLTARPEAPSVGMPRPPEPPTPPASATREEDRMVTIAKMIQQPKAKLRTFGGKQNEDFFAFKTAFFTVFPEEDKWTAEAQKLQQLKNHLQGTAQTAVAGLHAGKGALDKAWAVLDKRFGNKDIILARLQAEFAQMPAVTHTSKVHHMRKVLDMISTMNHNYIQFGETFDGTAAITQWLKKLPEKTAFQWLVKTKEPGVKKDAATFIPWLSDHIALQEEAAVHRVDHPRDKNGGQQQPEGQQHQQSRQRPQNDRRGPPDHRRTWRQAKRPQQPHMHGQPNQGGSASLFTAGTNQTSSPQCIACNRSGHYLSDCKAFLQMSGDQRRQLVNSVNMCMRCTRRGHSAHDCKAPANRTSCKVADCPAPATHCTLLH